MTAQKVLVALVFVFQFAIVQGQPGGGPGGGGDPGHGRPVPITGIEFLLAAGGILGAKKLFDARKNKRS